MLFNLNRKSESDTIILEVKLEDILEEKSLFNEEELRKSKELCAEEAMLRKEIQELETTEIEVIHMGCLPGDVSEEPVT